LAQIRDWLIPCAVYNHGLCRKKTKPAPASAHLLIRHAIFLTMDPNLGELPDADVRINDGQIIAVGKDLPSTGAQVIGATGMILIASLVDA
jgi:predicted amidohydrolase